MKQENSPFTPACKRFSSSTCDANSELVQASRIAVDSEEGDAPNLVYAGPECASAGSNANRNLGGDVVVVPTAPPFAGDYRPVSSCTRGEFACWNNRDYVSDGCISKRYLCDGDNDCGDDSDVCATQNPSYGFTLNLPRFTRSIDIKFPPNPFTHRDAL